MRLPKPFLILALLTALLRPAPAGERPDVMAELDKLLSAPLPAAAEPAKTVAADSPPSAPEPARDAIAAAVAAATAGPAAGLFPAVRARVTARRHAVLSSQTSGRVEELTVRDGDRIALGQLLVRLDATLVEIQLERARAAFRRQELIYQMTRELGELQSKGEIEVEVARMEMEQAAADLRGTEKILTRSRVLAPFPGRVAEVFAREKQFVAEGQPLLEVLDDSTLELEFIVSSKWIDWFKPGFEFEVTVEETGRSHRAVLDRLGGKVDPLSQSMKAYAVFADSIPDLMEGMSGEARIQPPPGARR